jgi:hypothetical protein
MTIQVITHNSGRPMIVGSRNPSLVRRKGLSLKNYLTYALPVPPDEVIMWTHASATWLKQVLLNDQLGCCTISGGYHIAGSWLADVGESIPFSNVDVLRSYEGACGYVNGNPATDQGGNEQDVLDWFCKNGLLADGSHKFTNSLYVDASKPLEVKQSHWLLRNSYWGMSLPDAWIRAMSTMQDGDTWDVAGPPNPANGHCVAGQGHIKDGRYIISTWGFEIYLTPAAAAMYAVSAAGGECHAILGPDSISIASGKAPNGFDASQLIADEQAIAA